MNSLPEGWEEITLGDLFEIGSSKRVHKHEWQASGVPFFRAREIKKLALEGEVDNDLFVTPELFSDYAQRFGVPAQGDLMVTAVGTLGVCYRVQEGDKFYFKDASVLWFRNAFGLDTEFFEKLFLSEDVQTQVHQGGGTTVGTYTIGAAKGTRVLLPPDKEQRRIVEKLDQLSARTRTAKDHLAHVQTLATRAKQATLAAAMAGPLSEVGQTSWPQVEASELFKWSSGKNLPKRKQIDGPYPVYGGNGEQGKHNEFNREEPTIVVGRVGAHCGNVHLTTKETWITDNAIFAQSFAPSVNLQFAELVFASAKLNELAGGTGQPYVNQGILNAVEFPDISYEEQTEIVRRIEAAYARIDRMVSEATRAAELLERLEAQLLAKAFRGELVPQDPNEEPASALLARIREARARARKPKRRGKTKTK